MRHFNLKKLNRSGREGRTLGYLEQKEKESKRASPKPGNIHVSRYLLSSAIPPSCDLSTMSEKLGTPIILTSNEGQSRKHISYFVTVLSGI